MLKRFLQFVDSRFVSIGMTLVDLVNKKVVSAGTIQSHANTSRIAGSLVSFLLGLPIYGCSYSNALSISDRTIICKLLSRMPYSVLTHVV